MISIVLHTTRIVSFTCRIFWGSEPKPAVKLVEATSKWNSPCSTKEFLSVSEWCYVHLTSTHTPPFTDTCSLPEEQTAPKAFYSSSTGYYRSAVKSGFLMFTYMCPWWRKDSKCMSSILCCASQQVACSTLKATALPASKWGFGEWLLPKGETDGKLGMICISHQTKG